jgi:hypothetical protein
VHPRVPRHPPYYGFAGVAEDEERDLIALYYVNLKDRFGITPRAINELYVRFLRPEYLHD